MKPEGSAECHQTLSSRGWGLGTRLHGRVRSTIGYMTRIEM